MIKPRSVHRMNEARRLLDAAMKQLDKAAREPDSTAKLREEAAVVSDGVAELIERLDRAPLKVAA